MSLPGSVRAVIEPVTGAVRAAQAVGGGCIAHATRVEAGGGRFFVKWAEGAAGASFEAEARGLKQLASAQEQTAADLVVPVPLLARDAGTAPGVLVLPWLEAGRPTPSGWRSFGSALAQLHRAAGHGDRYGAEADNWIGSTPQRNAWHTGWPAFFRDERLRPQMALARESARWHASWDGPADRLLAALGDVLPERPHPAPLHGDLWSGNALALADGRFALIDPAAYVGHRETDLALSELFGGFGAGFYEAYSEAWPLEHGYAERREVYNLYHLLNHLNLFGASYAGGVERTLRRFG